MEVVGRSEYLKPETDDKDPIAASLFYLALRKKHIVVTLWKQAGGHSDQRNMLKFLVNDFEEPRWRTAALKNAYALLSKQRFCECPSNPTHAYFGKVLMETSWQYSRPFSSFWEEVSKMP